MKNMKRRILIAAMLPVLFILLGLQSCTKDNPTFKVFNSFSAAKATAPLDAAQIFATGTSVDLKWAATDADGDAPKANVYFGLDSNPPLFKSGVAGLSQTVTVATGKTYYWKIVMVDANNVTTTSPVFSFTVLVKFDMANMVGLFDCNEPGYAHYNCNFTSVNATTVLNDNFWDSGYKVQYVFNADGSKIDIIPVTYDGYAITGTGSFDKMTGQWSVHYLVKKASNGSLVDDNTHTFTKK
jgi:hypothetical protein